MKKTYDYIHRYRGYWSGGGKCRIRIFQEDGRTPMVVCSQLPDNDNTSVTNLAEYLAAEVIEEHSLPTPMIWIEHYPEHEEDLRQYSLVAFFDWKLQKVCLGGVWRYRVGSPRWMSLSTDEVKKIIGPLHRSGRRSREGTVEVGFGVAVEVPLTGKSRPASEDGEGDDLTSTERWLRSWLHSQGARVARVVDRNVKCSEEGVHIEHEESVPFPSGSVGKPTLAGGHLPLI